MRTLLATQIASMNEPKRDPVKLIQDAHGEVVAIINDNMAAAYLVPPETFKRLINWLEDQALQEIVAERLSDSHTSIKVNSDDL